MDDLEELASLKKIRRVPPRSWTRENLDDLEELARLKKIRTAAIRAQRKIYSGGEPCAVQVRNPAFAAAVLATERATAACNAVIDRIEARRAAED